MELNIKYSDSQLEHIREQGFIYRCACPSQVSAQIVHLQQLFNYQQACMSGSSSMLDMKTHQLIAKAASQAHDILQTCLHDVLVHENWDLETLEMPAELRQLLDATKS